MSEFAKSRDILKELYGLEFPDSLFHLHAFFSGMSDEEQEALRMWPSGLLSVLSLPRQKLARLKPKYPILLHYRFYRDPPEFFTCLHGDCDGEHWGILLDEPDRGFRGMAAYYNNDGDRIRVYFSPFDAILNRIDHFIEETDEAIEDEPDQEDYWRGQEQLLRQIRERLERYTAEHGIPLDGGRPRGIESDTGLTLIVPGSKVKKAPTIFQGHQFETQHSPRMKSLIRNAVAECTQDKPLGALSIGRSLHYWGGSNYSQDAYQLLRAAYEALGRTELIRILDVHHQYRDLPNVDVLSKK
jgi:hypothetical protein